MKGLFIEDYERFTPHKFNFGACFIRLIRNHELRYIFWGRINQESDSKIIQIISSMIIRSYRRKYGLELNFCNLGGGYSSNPSMEYNDEFKCNYWKKLYTI